MLSRVAAAASIVSLGAHAAPVDSEWESFKTKFNKEYSSDAEEQTRYKVFQETKERVARLNKLNGEPVFGITWMADRHPEEKHGKGLRKPEGWEPTAPVKKWGEPKNPPGINWRLTEAITPIKNQGQCGSCWAFSATEAVESQMILGTGGTMAIALSPQQVTSCAPNDGQYPCAGCQGGWPEGAYEYLKTVPGLANDFYIPYEQSMTEQEDAKACPTDKVDNIAGPQESLQGGFAEVTGYSYAVPACTSGDCTNQDLQGLATALESSPVSICVNAQPWGDYIGGVMTAQACPGAAEDEDHCVMATGFNTTASTPYWIVRNSWSSMWGEEGYIYLEMSQNTCGVANEATIPDVRLDLSEDNAATAAQRREDMYFRATQGYMRKPSKDSTVLV